MAGPRGDASGWVLAIETSNPSAQMAGDAPGAVGPSVALGTLRAASAGARAGVEVIEVEPLSTKGRHDDDLMPAIDRVTRRAGVGPMDLGVVAFSAGPGGFTGLRIAATIAKVIAETTGAEVVPVPSAVAATRHLPAEAFPAVVLLASKRGTAHATVIDADGQTVRTSGVISGESFEPAGARSLVCDQHGPEGIVAAAASAGLVRYLPAFSAASCLACVPWFSAVDPLEAGPIYAREPEAVRKWRELGR